MGDVYEYLFGKIAAAGENGQFRTSRHVIRMIVELGQPKLDDRRGRAEHQIPGAGLNFKSVSPPGRRLRPY